MRLLVTGATQGIGRGIVDRALAEGHSVLAHGRNDAALADLAARGASTVQGELRDGEALRRIAAAAADFGVDAVIASQGVAGDGALTTLTPERIRTVMEVNTASAIRLYEALRPALVATNGTYVVIASQASLRPEMYDSAYCASKWAALHWVVATAAAEREHGVRVRAICPGRTATALYDDAMAGFAAAAGMSLPDYTSQIMSVIPLRRVATVDETAGAALYLAAHDPRPVVLAETGGEVPYAVTG